MKKTFIYLTTFIQLSIFAQPTIEWQKNYIGSNEDEISHIVKCSDGGTLSIGRTSSNDGDFIGNHGMADCFAIKNDANGNTIWKKLYGGSGGDGFSTGLQTNDGGYLLAGYTYSNDGDVWYNHGQADVWLVRINSLGDIVWRRSFGGSGFEHCRRIISTNDGGYIMAGNSDSADGNLTANKGSDDSWIVKFDSFGDIVWEKSFGGDSYDYATSIIQNQDGTFIFTGTTYSNNGDVSGHKPNTDSGQSYNYDIWVVKLTNEGNILWQKCVGGTKDDQSNTIVQSIDGNVLISGFTSSDDEDVINYHGGVRDAWIFKFSQNGNLMWSKTFGGSEYDEYYQAIRTIDGGYLFVGSTTSNDGDVMGNSDSFSFWIVKTDNTGTIIWQKPFSISDVNYLNCVVENDNGSIVVAGAVENESLGVPFDLFLAKFGQYNSLLELESNIEKIYPNPTNGIISIKTKNLKLDKGYSLRIENLIGQEVFSILLDEKESVIDISKLGVEGAYFVSILDLQNNVIGVEKIILR